MFDTEFTINYKRVMSRGDPGDPNDNPEFKATVKKKLREALKSNPEFDDFLRQNNAEGRYIRSATEQIVKRGALKLDTVINTFKYYITNVINTSMTWSETKEGHAYWDELHSKFRSLSKK